MAKWRVPAIPQKTIKLCWEAVAQSMWVWRYKNKNNYSKKAGNYLKMNRGLLEREMDVFYKKLGILSLKNPRGENVRHALKWSPVIITEMGKQAGHALLVTGFDGKQNYSIVNPCAVLVLNFGGGPNSCSAGTNQLSKAHVDSKLGSFIWYWGKK